MKLLLLICLLLAHIFINSCTGQAIKSTDKKTLTYTTLPEGNNGIAANHPGDIGIADDPAVIFADDFESYTQPSQLGGRWNEVYHPQYVALTRTPVNVYRGKQALELIIPQQSGELSNGTDKYLNPGHDVLFLRYYARFHAPFDVIGSSHNGSSISANYFQNGHATPGVPADGTNKFLANLENWRADSATASPGLVNIYLYHPEQRSEYGDHLFPSGEILPFSMMPFDFGKNFISRPEIIPSMDQWICYEYMVLANTPGKRDGRIAIWIDGKLAADFMNLRLRDIERLKIDRFGLSFHIKTNPKGEARKWYDNVVAASSYIGPIY